MNLNVDTLAPLEDSLVLEITEHERGCEKKPRQHVVGDCTTRAVALIHTCLGSSLCCSTMVAQFESALRVGGTCAGCRRLMDDCWSVVVLP